MKPYKYYKFKLNWIFRDYEIRNLKKFIRVIDFRNLKEINYLNIDYKKIDNISIYHKDYKKFYKELKKDLEKNNNIEYIELII